MAGAPSCSVIVVGGGISGLVAARSLVVEHGVPAEQVTLLEASERVGGVLHRREIAGNPVDVGAESVLTTRPEATALLAELGLDGELRRPTGVPASVWTRGALHPVPRGTLMGIPGDPSGLAGLLTPAEVERADDRGREHTPVTGDLSLGELVEERLGAAVVDRLLEPLLGGVYAGQARRLSARACLPRVHEAASAGASLTATVAELTAGTGGTQASPRAATDGAPRPAPPFASLPGGLARLPEEIAEDLARRGVDLRLGVPAEALEQTAGGWVVTTGAGERLEAERVVVALPAPAAARLLALASPAAAEQLAGIETASMAVVTWAYETAALPALERSGFLVPPVDGRAIKAATFTAAKWGPVGDGTASYLRASLGRAGDAAVLDHGDDELAALALADVREAVALLEGAPSLPEPVATHVQRWDDALPQYAVGHVERIAAVRAAVAGLPGLELAGSAYDGVGIPACIGTARAAAAALVAGGTMAP
ncbi:oxygen-dependent protoporphyrinogen oxidase [Kytococcus aerolatus]|uniref:Coproporphyrinogen III oxidase n=1 Tax=Kytococcus aerolatus TaxID=592308 RepID=A0A212T3W7_9MICO|nr:oxygen-dependent protoporphyrinogen oxidase [Kytococcus aerolatus]